MAINNPDDINDLLGQFESDVGITTQNNVGVGGTPTDANLWSNQKLLGPPQNFIQATETSMPAFRATATPNISPAVSFDGVDDLLKTLTNTFFFLASHTIAMVVKFPPTLPVGNPVTLAHVTGFGSGGEVLRIMPSGDLEIQNEAGTDIPVSVAENFGWARDTWSVVLWTVDNVSLTNDFFDLRIDQIPVGGTGFSSVIGPPNGFSLGSFEDGMQSADIEVAAVTIYKRKLSATEIVDLENFLITKYFVVAPPPPPGPAPLPPNLNPVSALGLDKKVPRFIDLDLDFIANPITGQVPRKFDEEAVKRALRNLLQLNKYEKPFHPEIDPKIRSMLFEPVGPAAAVLLQRRIIEVVNQFEPRVELVDVQVIDEHETNAYNVVIAFRTANSDEPVTITLSLTRVR